MYNIIKKTQLFGFWIMVLLLVGTSSMGVVYSDTPIRSERLVISPEEGFLEIEFGASSGVMRELLG
jgi:hypothetical protein